MEQRHLSNQNLISLHNTLHMLFRKQFHLTLSIKTFSYEIIFCLILDRDRKDCYDIIDSNVLEILPVIWMAVFDLIIS